MNGMKLLEVFACKTIRDLMEGTVKIVEDISCIVKGALKGS